MTVLSLRLPESMHRKLAQLAESEGISINQLINSAIAEKMAALLTEEYLTERAGRGSRRKFVAAMSKAADGEPRESMANTSRRSGTSGELRLHAEMDQLSHRSEFQHRATAPGRGLDRTGHLRMDLEHSIRIPSELAVRNRLRGLAWHPSSGSVPRGTDGTGGKCQLEPCAIGRA